jgi:flagellin-like hook-associated protein FlgL
MRVAQKTIYDGITRNLNLTASGMIKANEVVSSGKRINTLSDDPVGLSTVLYLRSGLSNIDQLERNISVGNSWLSTGESSLTQVESLLSDAKSFCVQMGSATTGSSQRANGVEVVEGYLNQLLALANTQIGGRYIFGGTRTDTAPFVMNNTGVGTAVITQWSPQNAPSSGGSYTGATPMTYTFRVSTAGAIGGGAVVEWSTDGVTWTQHTPVGGGLETVTGISTGLQIDFGNPGDTLAGGDTFSVSCHYPTEEGEVNYQGNATPFAVNIGKDTLIAIGKDGEQIFGADEFNWDDPQAGTSNVFKTLLDLKQYLQGNNVAGIQGTMQKVDAHLEVIRANVSESGAKSLHLSMRESIIKDLSLTYTERASQLEDADLAEAVTTLQSRQLAYQATLSSSSRVMQLSLVDYL